MLAIPSQVPPEAPVHTTAVVVVERRVELRSHVIERSTHVEGAAEGHHHPPVVRVVDHRRVDGLLEVRDARPSAELSLCGGRVGAVCDVEAAVVGEGRHNEEARRPLPQQLVLQRTALSQVRQGRLPRPAWY